MLNDGEKGAVLQRDRETYGIAPHLPCGLVTPEILRKIADVAERYRVPVLKITSAARIAMLGIREEDIDAIWDELGIKPGSVVGICVRSIKVCPGTTYCKRGQADSLGVGRVLDEYHGLELPGKMKIGVSGCRTSAVKRASRTSAWSAPPRAGGCTSGAMEGPIPGWATFSPSGSIPNRRSRWSTRFSTTTGPMPGRGSGLAG